jgi:hypothetical protein
VHENFFSFKKPALPVIFVTFKHPKKFKRMKKLILSSLIAAALIAGCKKKETPPPALTSTTTTGGTTGGTTTGGNTTGGTPTTATEFCGFFAVTNFTMDYMGISSKMITTTASFTDTPVSMLFYPAGIRIGYVMLNNDSLRYDTMGHQYISPKLITSLNGETWNVGGKDAIPSFTFQNNLIAPGGLNSNAIPATLTRSSGLNFSLNNLTNVKIGSLLISDNSGSANGAIIKPLVNGNNVISYSAAELNGLTTTTNGVIYVTLDNNQGMNFGGKNFKFSRQAMVYKSLTIN